MSEVNHTAIHPQYYRKTIALNPEIHADWKIRSEISFEFARQSNAVLITMAEFHAVSSEYPIVFIEYEDQIRPLAVLGLKSGQNLFINETSGWDARYIPAYVRRYPFILAGAQQGDDTQYAVCIDEQFEGFNRHIGEPLFTESGEYSQYLKTAITFLKIYQEQGKVTDQFCRQLRKLDLLEPMQANISLEAGENLALAGFLTVSLDRLKKLKPVTLAELVKSDRLAPIYQHLDSLVNFKQLVERYSATGSTAPEVS